MSSHKTQKLHVFPKSERTSLPINFPIVINNGIMKFQCCENDNTKRV